MFHGDTVWGTHTNTVAFAHIPMGTIWKSAITALKGLMVLYDRWHSAGLSSDAVLDHMCTQKLRA